MRQVLLKGKKMSKFVVGLTLAVSCFFSSGALAQETISLGTANTVTLRGEINDGTVMAAAAKLEMLDRARAGRGYTIYLVLDSPGGDIEAGEMLIEVAKTIPNLKTITVFAASMASAIVEALPGDRLIIDSASIMFHRAKGQVAGQFETGELESRLDFYKRYVRRMEQRNANRLGMSLKTYKRKIKNELWYTGPDAVLENAADRLVNVKCSQALSETIETQSMQIFIFKITLNFSGCPIMKGAVAAPDQPKEVVDAYQKFKEMQNKELQYETN